jgi:phage-related protein
MKEAEFLGNSLSVIRSFPADAKREAGFQIDRIQNGKDPEDWKPLKTVGPGVREIRIREDAGAFRVIYAAQFHDAIYILHAFQKKTRTTSKGDIEIAKRRFAELVRKR